MKKLITKYRNWFFYWAAVGVGFFILFFLVTSSWIGVSVKEKCLIATARYEKEDCVFALMDQLQDENTTYREKNYAIWALGQLGDDRALSILENMYTGIIPDREPYDDGISQYELKKAIKLIDDGFNATAFVWR
ncbi:HEAT repeat domain-containing protein [Candidatus Woesebacteria bacterium]|nr:HEAT repeat domain-containing protein [Candidatus Woesebacteria bacterium]